jgi:hypothetical protein
MAYLKADGLYHPKRPPNLFFVLQWDILMTTIGIVSVFNLSKNISNKYYPLLSIDFFCNVERERANVITRDSWTLGMFGLDSGHYYYYHYCWFTSCSDMFQQTWMPPCGTEWWDHWTDTHFWFELVVLRKIDPRRLMS